MTRTRYRAAVALLLLVTAAILALLPSIDHAAQAHAASRPGHAAQAVRPAQGFPAIHLCIRNQSTNCFRLVNDSTTGGTAITVSPFSNNQSEQWGVILVNVAGCGTHVIGHGSGACPFPLGSGLNAPKDGLPIVKVENVNLTCFGFDGSGLSVNKTVCGNDNTFTTVFVQADGGFSYISVPLSAQAGAYRYITRVSNGGQMKALPFDSANSQWGAAS